jgi:hypothetical protein
MADSYLFPDSTPEGIWLKQKLYTAAMKAWIDVVKNNELMAIYFFRQLPTWIRDMYLEKHPEKAYLVKYPLSKFIEQTMSKKYVDNPELQWAERMLYNKGKNVPAAEMKVIQDIMVRNKVWDDRSNWSQEMWRRYWSNETITDEGLTAYDLHNLPLLQRELNRVIAAFGVRPFRRYWRQRRLGEITPIF